jgi:hypothetical protein
VHEVRKNGRVVDVVTLVILGTAAAVQATWTHAVVSRTVNTTFVERHNGTDRDRTARKTDDFSKELVDPSGGDLLQHGP